MRALLLLALVACGDNYIPADAATDDAAEHSPDWNPAAQHCCEWFYKPWKPRPAACLASETDWSVLVEGQCAWLECLGGLVTYEVCR